LSPKSRSTSSSHILHPARPRHSCTFL
jgi:hypothetical protein